MDPATHIIRPSAEPTDLDGLATPFGTPNFETLAERTLSRRELGVQPWSEDARAIIRDWVEATPSEQSALSNPERFVYRFAGMIHQAFSILDRSPDPCLQFEFPVLFEGLMDAIETAQTSQFPRGRTFVRRSFEACESILEGRALERSPRNQWLLDIAHHLREVVERNPSEREPHQYSWQRNDVHRALLNEVRRIWLDYPECLYEQSYPDIDDLRIRAYSSESPPPDSVLEELERLQRDWISLGKDGIGTVDDVETLKELLSEPGTRTTLLRFSLEDATLGYYVIQNEPSALSRRYMERIHAVEDFERVHARGIPSAWGYLVVLTPTLNGRDIKRDFESSFQTPLYEFITYTARSYALSYGARVLFGVVNRSHPGREAHHQVGYVATGHSIELPFGTFNVIAVPTELPKAVEHNLQLLGTKKRLPPRSALQK